MATIQLSIDELPGLLGEPGPFAFELQRPSAGGTAVLTIPIVHRGPESFAESAAQERWVAQRYPDLEMCFAGAWRTDDLQRFDGIARDLAELAGGVAPQALWQLSELHTQAPPLERDGRGVALVSPRSQASDEERRAARARDLAVYDQLIAQAPQLAEAWLLRAARRHGEHEDYPGALLDCQRAAALAPSRPEAWSGQGQALLALGRFAEAVQPLQRAVAAAQGSAATRIHLAFALEKAGDFAGAAAQLRKAAPPNHAGPSRPGDCAAHLARGRCLTALGKADEALQALAAAARCQPGNAAVSLQQSQLLDALGDRPEQALAAAKKACRLALPGEVEPLFWQAALLRRRGEPQQAVGLLDAAAALAPQDPRLAGERGLALCDLGQFAQAAAELDAYLARVSWTPALLARARCRRALGDGAAAQADLQAVLAADPGDAQAQALQAAWRAADGER